MLDFNTKAQTITLNINGPSTSIKTQRPSCMLSQETLKNIQRETLKGRKQIYHKNSNLKNARVAIII